MRQVHWLRNAEDLATPLSDLEPACAQGSCLSPAIPDGAAMFIDPRLTPRPGDYVCVRMDSPIPGTDIYETIKRYDIATDPAGRTVELICNSAGRFRLVDEKIVGVVVAFVDTGKKSRLGLRVDAAHAQTIANIERMHGEKVAGTKVASPRL